MFARPAAFALLFAISTVPALAADFGGRFGSGADVVPGGDVSFEGGVRVIRPANLYPFETEAPGVSYYHGAAFYWLPDAARGKARQRSGVAGQGDVR
jgi:hypothetical protein